MPSLSGGGSTAMAPRPIATKRPMMPMPGATGSMASTSARANANSGSSMFNAGPTPPGLVLHGGPGQGTIPLPGGMTSTLQPMGSPTSSGMGGGSGTIFGGPALQPGPQPIAPSNPFAPPTMGGGGASTPQVPGPRPPGVTTTGGPGGGGFTVPPGGEGSIPLPPSTATPPPLPPVTTPATGGGPAPGATPSFLEILMQQFGRGNPFGDLPSGPDPVAAARAQADAWVNPRLADLRERFAGTGIASNSGRSGLEQGRLAGAAEAGLGTNLAQLGVQQRGSDLDRLMQGVLGSGQLSISQQQLPLQALQLLLGGANTQLGLQESERLPPLLQMLMPFLTNFAPQRQVGYSTQR